MLKTKRTKTFTETPQQCNLCDIPYTAQNVTAADPCKNTDLITH